MASYASGVAFVLPVGIKQEADGNDLVHAPLQGLTRVQKLSRNQYTGRYPPVMAVLVAAIGHLAHGGPTVLAGGKVMGTENVSEGTRWRDSIGAVAWFVSSRLLP